MAADCTYELTLASPQGPQVMRLRLTTDDGAAGFISEPGKDGEQEVQELVLDGNVLSFKLPITVPMSLTLAFDATINGDLISGSAKVGGAINLTFDGKRI